MIPAQAPNEGEEPTMRKGSYSEELVRIVRSHWPCNSDSVNHRRRDHEDVDDEHLDGDAPDAHVIADGHAPTKSTQVQRDPVSGAVPPEAWPPSMPNIRSARPETGSLAGTWAYALPSV